MDYFRAYMPTPAVPLSLDGCHHPALRGYPADFLEGVSVRRAGVTPCGTSGLATREGGQPDYLLGGVKTID